MTQIPIKIKSNSKTTQQEIKKALNLNQLLSAQAKSITKNRNKSWLNFSVGLILIMILIVLAANFFWSSSKSLSAYQKLTPKQAQAAIFFKIYELKNLYPAVIPNEEQNASFYQWLKNRILQFLADSGISAENDLLPLFQEQAAFFILPPDRNQKLSWLILAETKSNQDPKRQLVFNKIEQELKKDFGFNQTFYRQLKINIIYPLDQLERQYFYAQINNFVAVSNSQTTLENLIDRIIGR